MKYGLEDKGVLEDTAGGNSEGQFFPSYIPVRSSYRTYHITNNGYAVAVAISAAAEVLAV